ncbi:MAG: hypothetical protein LBJ77_02580 [Holosporales bacterium]|jgi:hypothetical protein|nr:hypothetical protein [Holosporales bacterium]
MDLKRPLCLILCLSFLGSAGAEEAPSRPHRNRFTAAEDARLLELVEHHGSHAWSVVAEQMEGRNGRQCRERYYNYLRPDRANQPWTTEQLGLLQNLYEDNCPLSRITREINYAFHIDRSVTSVRNQIKRVRANPDLAEMKSPVMYPPEKPSAPASAERSPLNSEGEVSRFADLSDWDFDNDDSSGFIF